MYQVEVGSHWDHSASCAQTAVGHALVQTLGPLRDLTPQTQPAQTRAAPAATALAPPPQATAAAAAATRTRAAAAAAAGAVGS